MNKEYIDSLTTIEDAKYKLNKLYESEIKGSMENRRAYRTIENLIEALDDAERVIKHYSKSIKEGVLHEGPTQKFCIEFNDGSSSHWLGCGSDIEIYLNENDEEDIYEGWHDGRIEHNGKGYYFHGPGRPMLYSGMRVRVRD